MKSRHGSGKMLHELADVAIDNCVAFGDACIPVGDGTVKAGATSSIAGVAIANMLTVGFAERCEADGIDPPVFESANADVDEQRTLQLVAQYRNQIHYV